VEDIKGYTSFGRIEPVTQGWSGDRKYYIETHPRGKNCFYAWRISPTIAAKGMSFEMLEKGGSPSASHTQAVDFGICEQGRAFIPFLPGVRVKMQSLSWKGSQPRNNMP